MEINQNFSHKKANKRLYGELRPNGLFVKIDKEMESCL